MLLEKGVYYDQFAKIRVFLGKTLLAFALLHFVLQSQTCLYSRCLLTSYFCLHISYDEKDILMLLLLVIEGLVGLHRMGKPSSLTSVVAA